MAIRIHKQLSRRRGEASPDSRKRLKKLRSVKVTNPYRLSMRGTSSRLTHRPVILSDEAMESSNSNSPNYMKATSSSNARRSPLQTSPATPEYYSSSSTVFSSNKSSKILTRKNSLRRVWNSVKMPASKPSNHVGDDRTPAIKSQKSLKSFSSLKRFWRMSSLKSRKSSRDGNITSADPEPCVNGTESSSVHLPVSDEDAKVMATGSDSEEISSCFLPGGDLHKHDGKFRDEAEPQRLEKSRSIKLKKLKSVRFRRRWSKSRLDQASVFASGNEAEMELTMEAEMPDAQPHYMKATASQYVRKMRDQKPVNASKNTAGFKSSGFLKRVPSLRSRKSTLRKRAQVPPLLGNPDRPTSSSNHKSCNFSEQVELQSGECESAETSTLHVCSYHYCSLHGHHNDPLPPLKGFVSAKRRSLKSQGRKRQSESRSPSEAKESRSVIKSKQARDIISSKDHVGQDSTIVDTAAHGNHEDFHIESYIQSAENLANEGIQKTDGEAVNRDAVKEMEGPQSSDVSSSPKVPDDKILNNVDVVAADSGLHLELNESTSASQPAKGHSSKDIAAGVTLACAVDKLDSTTVNEETYRSLSVPWKYPTVNADATSREEIATDVLTDQQKYTNMWQLIYQHSISKIQPEVERQEITEAGDDQDADITNIAEINELESKHEETQELDMVSAVKLVQEAISAILQTYEHPSNHNSTCSETVDEEEIHSVTEDPCILPPTDSAKSDFSKEDREKDMDKILVPKDMQQITEKQCTTGQEKLDSNEEKVPTKQMSKGFKKLRTVFAFTKFIRAMENLRRINPEKQRHPSREDTAEAGVRLRPLNMDERRSADEWMLDYALRQVISKLAPEEQRRVAHLVEAFETVNPELKEVSRKRSHMKTETVSDTASATTVHNKDYKFDASDHEIPDSSTQEQQKKEIYVAPGAAITIKEEISVISDNGDLRLGDGDHTASTITSQNVDEKCVASDQNGSRFCDFNVQKPDKDEKFVGSAITVPNQEEEFVADQERFTTFDGSAQKPEEEKKYVASVTTVDSKEENLVAFRHEDSATNACGEEEKFAAFNHEDSRLRDSGTEEKDTKGVTFEDAALCKHSLQENNAVDISSLNKDLYDDLVSNTFNSPIHNEASTEGFRVSQPLNIPTNSREKSDSCHNDKLLSRSSSNDDSGNGNKTNILKGILLDKQKYNSIWLLLIQQVQSSNAAEAEGQTVDKWSENGQCNHGITSSFEKVVDGEAGSNDAGYKKLELTQSDADRLIQEALDGILRQTDSYEPGSTVTSKNPDGKPSEDTKGIFEAKSVKSPEGDVGESKISASNDSAHDIFQEEESTAIDMSLEPENTCVSSDATITSEQKQRGLSEDSSKRKISRAYSKLRKAVLCNKFIKAMENMQKVYAQKQECPPMEPDAGYQNICLRPCSTDDTKNAEQWMLDHALQKVIAKLAPSQQRRVALLVDAFEKVKPDAEKTSKEASYDAEQIESVSSSSEVAPTFHQAQNDESYFGSENLTTDGEDKESPVQCLSINNNRGAPLYQPCTGQSKEEPAATKDADGASDKAEGSLQDKNDHNSPGAAGNDFLDTPKYSSMWNLIYRHIKSGIADNSEVQSSVEAHPCGPADDKRQAFVLHQSSEADDDEDMETQSTGSTNGELLEQEAIKLVQEAVNELFLSPGQPHEEEQSTCLGNDGGETSITDGKAVEGEKMAPKSSDKTDQNCSRSLSKLSRVILCKRFIKAMDERRKLRPKDGRCLPEQSNSERETIRLKHQGTNGKGSYDEWMLDNALQQVIGRLAPAQKRRVSMLVQAFETIGPQPEDENRRKVNAAA